MFPTRYARNRERVCRPVLLRYLPVVGQTQEKVPESLAPGLAVQGVVVSGVGTGVSSFSELKTDSESMYSALLKSGTDDRLWTAIAQHNRII